MYVKFLNVVTPPLPPPSPPLPPELRSFVQLGVGRPGRKGPNCQYRKAIATARATFICNANPFPHSHSNFALRTCAALQIVFPPAPGLCARAPSRVRRNTRGASRDKRMPRFNNRPFHRRLELIPQSAPALHQRTRARVAGAFSVCTRVCIAGAGAGLVAMKVYTAN